MAERRGPAVYTIPPHRAFADALAAGLIARSAKGAPLALARGLVLLPNNRAARALRDAFVRRSDGNGLLLPRMVVVGDLDLDEHVGVAIEAADPEGHIPPAIDACTRRMLLARLVSRFADQRGDPVGAGEAVRLAGQLGRTLDQLIVEQVDPARLRSVVPVELAAHWEHTLAFLKIVTDFWPAALAERGEIDASDRRNRLLEALIRRWRDTPPDGFVVAAGVTTSAPAISALLRVVARLPEGLVVFPGLDLAMPDEEWVLLDCEDQPLRPCETHPQYALKLLLDRIGVARGEVVRWRWSGGRDAPPSRTRVIERALAPAEATDSWQGLAARDRRLTGVKFVEAATPAEEAQIIALALREVLDTPRRTAALVTPDRLLARRVAAHLHRWGIGIDDSAGRPLRQEPTGAFLAAIVRAAVEGFAPVALLAMLKHPFAGQGVLGGRAEWLENARALDLVLRGPRPAAGLDGVTRAVADAPEALRAYWQRVHSLLLPLEAAFAPGTVPLAALVRFLGETATALGGELPWAGPGGRVAADLLARMEANGPLLGEIDPAEMPALLDQMLAEAAVRPPYGGHPRLAIYGLLEARLQRADLMIMGGLNEGTWPSAPAPDPWLAPRLRAELGLPGLERRIGLAAHDFVAGLGAPHVLVTRARRDATAPTVPSRFWLRMDAMTGGLPREQVLPAVARALDQPDLVTPATRPAPSPPLAARRARISVTAVDRLKADPYSFYARNILRLSVLDAIDADPSAAERGTAVHAILEAWAKEDGGDLSRLRLRAEAMMARFAEHPLTRVLWSPRLLEAIDWVAAELAAERAAGREILKVEHRGEAVFAGVKLNGTADRIDRLPDGTLGIVDYKTGKPPSAAQLQEGYALQLGLLGAIAEAGGFPDIEGQARDFAYWSLAKDGDGFGKRFDPTRYRGKPWIDAADFNNQALRHFIAVAERWLTGTEPFTSKLRPQYSNFAEFDQLARVAEWQGRDNG